MSLINNMHWINIYILSKSALSAEISILSVTSCLSCFKKKSCFWLMLLELSFSLFVNICNEQLLFSKCSTYSETSILLSVISICCSELKLSSLFCSTWTASAKQYFYIYELSTNKTEVLFYYTVCTHNIINIYLRNLNV